MTDQSKPVEEAASNAIDKTRKSTLNSIDIINTNDILKPKPLLMSGWTG
jgi:hypothetical protein